MFTLLQIELYKIFKRPRTYIAFAAITALIIIIQLGLKVDGKEYADFVLADLQNTLEINGKIINGYFVCYVILQLLLVHVPLLIALIAADMISGEANMGTLRVLLTKPISRTEFIIAKFLAAAIYTILLLIWIAVFALLASIIIFGTDDMFLVKNAYAVQIEKVDIFWRYIGAFCFAALAMLTVAALGFFLSNFAENSIGPIVATMSVIIVTTILSTMSIPLFNKIKPYLFTTHMVAWKEFFDVKVNDANETIRGTVQNADKIIRSSIVLIAHIILFVGASVWVFKKKDVLS
ncbi:MAG: ABC transporter permease subunit [Bacteroidetes bacterium]|nr:ABC transporter permease subunit [Bacteroidota bacterium]MBS1592531.1 ABC transporter permease subunit [Bacteroidota bacterium]MBS1643379.1 ABC transporter permease subunit [Bacteroidota bacterium]MBS1672014.1 ABC transporter permease subunit [Bacteroidota bacterium]